MLNELWLKNPDNTLSGSPMDQLFSGDILNQLNRFKAEEIDNLIIHGFPVPADLPPTPRQIREKPKDMFPSQALSELGKFLGTISPKGIENTIRFRTGGESANEETWHGHYQYSYSVFYCLRGDENAKTYFLSANSVIKNAPKAIANALLSPFAYFPARQPFALMHKSRGYEFSHEIFDRSDFEKYIKDLDLPDALKALERIDTESVSKDAQNTLAYLLDAIRNAPYITYKPGDVALYNEQSTMRFSPSYVPSGKPEEDRWILSLSVL